MYSLDTRAHLHKLMMERNSEEMRNSRTTKPPPPIPLRFPLDNEGRQLYNARDKQLRALQNYYDDKDKEGVNLLNEVRKMNSGLLNGFINRPNIISGIQASEETNKRKNSIDYLNKIDLRINLFIFIIYSIRNGK